MDRDFIIKEIRKIAQSRNIPRGSKIKREDITNNSQLVTRRHIERLFGGWSAAALAAGYRPYKHDQITDEDLFSEYSIIVEKIGHYPKGLVGRKEIDNISNYSSAVFRKRFEGGLEAFAIEYVKWSEARSQTVKLDKSSGKKVQTVSSGKGVDLNMIDKRKSNGDGAEYSVAAELRFRGYLARKIDPDEGIDVDAIKNEKYYGFQVKHGEYSSEKDINNFKITKSSFERNRALNVFYVFVMSRKDSTRGNSYIRDYLVLPQHIIDFYIKKKVIDYKIGSKNFNISVMRKSFNDAYLSKVDAESDVSGYLNSWDCLL